MTEFEEMVAEEAFAWALQSGIDHTRDDLYEIFWNERLTNDDKYVLMSDEDSQPMTDLDSITGEQPNV